MCAREKYKLTRFKFHLFVFSNQIGAGVIKYERHSSYFARPCRFLAKMQLRPQLIFTTLILLTSTTWCQYYMYTPGTAITIPPWDQFGGFIYCDFVQPSGCGLPPYSDVTLCQNVPSNVSITPMIEQIYRYGQASATGRISVTCETGGRINTKTVYTTDGTLPDIHGPAFNGGAYIDFDPSNPSPIVLARCIEAGKVPSRIAYFQRMIWDSAVNGSALPPESCKLSHYKELNLPRCDPNLLGTLCDGQTIVAIPPAPTTAPISTSTAIRVSPMSTIYPSGSVSVAESTAPHFQVCLSFGDVIIISSVLLFFLV